MTYRLYQDQTACDSDDWGAPAGEYPDLFSAMRAAPGIPVSCWRTNQDCPDETFTETVPQWTILGPGAAAEARAMRQPPPRLAGGRVTAMADLKAGTKVRHAGWGETGTIRVLGCVTEIRWDDVFGEIEVSAEGPVFPSDLEIIGGAP